jgi:hypothetical protein
MTKRRLEKEIEQNGSKIQRRFAEQVAGRVGSSPEKVEKDINKFIEESRSSLGEQKGKPPYRARQWYEDFFNLIQERTVEKVTLDFIRHNIASGSEAYKFQAGLRFLGLINKEGHPTSKLDKLRVTGDDFKKNLAAIINQAYASLFETIVVERAKSESVVNYVIEKYGYSRPLAEDTTRLFIYFCQKAGIPVSSELIQFQSSRREEKEKPPRKKPTEIREGLRSKDATRLTQADESFATLEFNEFTFSVKKDLASIEFARNQVNDLLDYLAMRLSEDKSHQR